MRYSGRNFYLLTGFGVALVLAAGLLRGAAGNPGLWSAFGFGGLMLLGFAASSLAYGALDDIQKQNLKAEWYWGSVIGLGALCGFLLPFVIFSSGAEVLADLLNQGETPRGYFLCGVAAALLPMGAGYFAVALLRRLRWMTP